MRRSAQVLLVVLSMNAMVVLGETVIGQLATQKALRRTFAALQTAPSPLRVWFSNFVPMRLRLREQGIAFEAIASPCPDSIGFIRSEVRVCVDDVTAPGWRRVLEESRRIDADLIRDGMPVAFQTLSSTLRAPPR